MSPVSGQLGLWSAGGSKPSEPSMIWTVSDLVRACSTTLEKRFGEVVVEGEVGSLGRPASGHVFFTLKDEGGQIQAVLFRGDRRKIPFDLQEGQRVRCTGRVAIYVQGGRFQLYVQWFEPVGLGKLLADLERLKAKLQEEGLFDDARKKPLPSYPKVIGVATSATGAAFRDIVKVLRRRWPVTILVSPTQVQGKDAPADIVRSLRALDAQPDVDVIVCGRGGGSTEDLWSFNDESVVRAIAACNHPVVSAVGHERDWVLADLAADARAATPSAAAELVTPHKEEVTERIETLRRRILALTRAAVGTQAGRLASLERRLRQRVILRFEPRQRLSDLSRRLETAIQMEIKSRISRLETLSRALDAAGPIHKTAHQRKRLDDLTTGLTAAMAQSLSERKRKAAYCRGKLESLSPLGVLDRGYSLLTDQQGKPVRTWNDVGLGDRVTARLQQGRLECLVEERFPPGTKESKEQSP